MVIIRGIQICIPTHSKSAGAIIAKMELLLENRRRLHETRQSFLRKWARLRKALFLTQDYQLLRLRIANRGRGICELCNKRPGVHLHHVEPVAWQPRLALLDINCKWACLQCHKEEHSEL